MKKLGGVLYGLLPALVAFGIQFLVAIIAIIILMMNIMIKSMSIGIEGVDFFDIIIEAASDANFNLMVLLIANVVIGILFYLYYQKITYRKLLVNWNVILAKKNIGILLLLGIGSQLFISGVLTLIEPYFQKSFDTYEKTLETILGGNILLILVNTVILAPIVEEIIFRGLVLFQTEKVLPFLGANIVQAAAFGIYHGNIIQGVYAFGMGLLFGYVARKFNLYGSILLHMIINGSSFLVGLVPTAFIYYILILVIGAIFLSLGTVMLSKYKIMN